LPGVGVVLRPVAGDVDAAREPDPVLRCRVVEEPHQPGNLSRAADQPVVQPDRHHLRAARRALGMERVEGILEVLEELLAGDVAGRGGEAHVVGFQRIGDDQLVARADLQPIGQVVVIGVGDIGKAALLGHQTHGVGAAAAGVPAKGAFPDHLGMQADRGGDGFALFGLGHVLVFDPFQAVRGDLPPRGLHRGDLFGRPGKGGRDAVDRQRDATGGEQPVQPPEPGAGAVFIDRFHVPVALAGPGRGAGDVRKEGLGRGIAVQDGILAALFVVQHDLDRDLRPPGPGGIGRVGAISQHVARIAVHRGLPAMHPRFLAWKRRAVFQFLEESPILGATGRAAQAIAARLRKDCSRDGGRNARGIPDHPCA
jgi:hypothetical protein